MVPSTTGEEEKQTTTDNFPIIVYNYVILPLLLSD
jgi:hypothetical protein